MIIVDTTYYGTSLMPPFFAFGTFVPLIMKIGVLLITILKFAQHAWFMVISLNHFRFSIFSGLWILKQNGFCL